MISVTAMVNTSWVFDPRIVSYVLEQAERLISHARANKVVHNFAWTPLYLFPMTSYKHSILKNLLIPELCLSFLASGNFIK